MNKLASYCTYISIEVINMLNSDIRQKSMSPVLIVNGILLAAAGGITLHLAIIITTLSGYMSYGEALTGTISLYVGIASLIVPIAIIGSLYTKNKKTTTTAIVLLLIFIGVDLFVNLTPSIAYWGGGWGGLAVLVIYGIFRGITFQTANKGLKVPARGYGNGFLTLYGWSYLVTFVISFVLTLIAVSSWNPALLLAAYYTLLAQIYIDGISLGAVGLKFLVDAANKSEIRRKIIPVGAGVQASIEEVGEGRYQPIRTEEIATKIETTESGVRHCTYCGAKIFDVGKFCENCGQSLT